MISLEELKKKANSFYKGYLESKVLDKKDFFPLVIPSNKGKASEDLAKREGEISSLHKSSKNNGKKSYKYETKDINTRSCGKQTVITKIFFEDEEDFLTFINRKEDTKTFFRAYEAIKSTLDNSIDSINLDEWAVKNWINLCDKNKEGGVEPYWKNIALCASWLYKNPNSNLYMRSIPLEVHSKFIENNKSIIHSLLSDESSISEIKFNETYGLKQKPSFIRIRFLDPSFTEGKDFVTHELYITREDARELSKADFMKGIENIFIVENEIVYLTFPEKENSLLIWGHGFSADNFSEFTWLNNYKLYYFGDLDEHGYDILSKFRKSFRQTVSICMDKETLEAFSSFRVKGNVLSGNAIPQYLTSEEKEVFDILRADSETSRLEQERISQSYINEKVKSL